MNPKNFFQRLGDKFPTSSQKADSAETAWVKAAWLLILGFTLARQAFLFAAPLDLVSDEAYYWDWGRHPSAGYYSKPPMIGWLMALWGPIAGQSDALLRLPASFMAAVVLVSLFELGRHFHGARIGFALVLLAACSIGNQAMGLLFTIDAPFVSAWSLTLLAFLKSLDGSPKARTWSLVYSLAGIFGVLSKQMMLVFPVLACLFLWFSSAQRKNLGKPLFLFWLFSPWLGLIPTVLWNASHGWATVRHTAEHFNRPVWTLTRALGSFGTYLAGQTLLVGPVVVLALYRGLKTRPWTEEQRLLFLFCALPVALIGLLSLLQPVLLNWPAAYWVPGFLAVAGLALRSPPRNPLVGWMWKPQAYLFLAVCLGVLISGRIVALGDWDLTRRARGWSQLASEIHQKCSSLEKPDLLLVVGHRQYASLLGFYLPGQPRLHKWKSPGDADTQYDFWRPERAAKQVLVLSAVGDGQVPEDLRQAFTKVEFIGWASTGTRPKEGRKIALWRGYELKTWWDGNPLVQP